MLTKNITIKPGCPSLSSFIQTILSVLESHQILRRRARGLYRRSGISPCPEDLSSIQMLVEIIASSGGFCKRIERGTGRIGDPLTQRRDWLRDFMKTADENAAGADYTNCLLSFGRKHGMISSVGGAVEHRLGRRRADPQSNHSLSREAEGTGPMKPGNLRRRAARCQFLRPSAGG